VIVADTNLIAYLLILGQYSNEAESVYIKDPQWVAPLLWRSEFRNILAFYVRRELMDLNDAYGTMEQAERLMRGQEFEIVSARVLRLAATSGCSAYDCEFVALAQGLGVTMVTSDRILVARFKPTVSSMREFCS
jgi:predicted nucleic acid-binding protein